MQTSTGRRRVLLLGWLFLGAIHALHRHGCDIVLVAEPGKVADATSSGIVDSIVVVPDAADACEVLAGLERVGRSVSEFDLVLTTGERELVAAGVIGTLAGVAVRDVAMAVRLRDKYVQKRLVRSAGVPVAECAILTGSDIASLGNLRPSVVVKPIAGVGSRDTVRLDTEAELRGFAEEHGNRGPWLVESFVPGKEYSFDGVVRDGEVIGLAVSRYLENLITIHNGALAGAVALRPARFPEIYAEARELSRLSLKALGHAHGVFHVEAFHHDGRFTFGECAGRIGGGKIAETLRRQFGMDLEDEWARDSLSLPSAIPTGLRPTMSRPHGFVQLQTPAGVLARVPTDAELGGRDGVVHAEVYAQPGRAAPDTTQASDIQAGRIIMTADDEADVESALRATAAWFYANSIVAQR
jgi:hypothetical protein